MKILWSLLLLFSLWTCQSSRGQRLSGKDAFEDRLIQMYQSNDLQDTLALRERLTQLRQEIRQSDLDASSKFDLWLYLQQWSQANAFPSLPSTSPALAAKLSRFVTPSEQQAISRYVALSYFRQEYLDRLLLPPKRGQSFYQLNPQSLLLQELTAYPFQDVNSLLEIGVGDGGFGLLTQLFFEVEEHYLNEVDSNRWSSIRRQLDLLPSHLPSPKIIQGTKDQIGLEEQKVEAVLIRNSLHHFEMPEAMLADIKRHLLPGGRLYIFEEVLDPVSGHQHCEAAMTQDEIRFLLQIEGFRWIENYTIQSDWKQIMVFEPVGPAN